MADHAPLMDRLAEHAQQAIALSQEEANTYRQRMVGHHPYLLWKFKCAGVDLSRYLPPGSVPGEVVWQQCAAHDRSQAGGGL